MEMWSSPLVLLTTHRSGGTLLARLYNIHSDIVIWGEHGGLLNKMAEMQVIFDKHDDLSQPLAGRGIEQFIASKGKNTDFSPWVNPMAREDYIRGSRDFIRRTFTRYLRPMQRWGFKEIRYHTLTTARFLVEIFPSTQFVVLRRNLVEQCVSNIMVGWSLDRLRLLDAGRSKEEATKVVQDCAYALVAIDLGLAGVAESFRSRTLSITYHALAGESNEILRELYDFAGLRLEPAHVKSADRILAVKSGVTTTRSLGYITDDFVKGFAPDAISRAREVIAITGIDVARLREGRYSFLVGDHAMLDSHVSTIF